MVHAGRAGHGRRGEDLDALDRPLPAPLELFQVVGQLAGLLFRGPGVGDHEVGLEVLGTARVDLGEGAAELLEGMAAAAFVHEAQDALGDVLGGDLQEPGRVVLGELLDVFRAFQGQVVADAAADEDLLDAGDAAGLPHQPDEAAVAAVEAAAGKTVVVGAGGRTLHAVHIGRRPAQVVDEALPLGVGGHAPDLPEDGLFAAGDDTVALV